MNTHSMLEPCANNQPFIARASGLVYLVLIITGLIGLAYLPNQIYEADSLQLTLHNIQDHPFIFRNALLFQTLCFMAYVFLPLFLYRLFVTVNRRRAFIMVLLVELSIPLSLMSIICDYSALDFIDQTSTINIDSTAVTASQILLTLSDNSLLFAQLFWGGWLIPFGLLVYSSGFMPKWLGVLLITGGLTYLLKVTLVLIYEDFYRFPFASKITLPATIAEFTACLWLLFGVRNQRNQESNDN